jgi:hypothetical protein
MVVVSLIIKKATPLSKLNLLGNTEEGFRVLRLDESAAEVDEVGRTLQTFHRSDCISLEDPSSSHYIFLKTLGIAKQLGDLKEEY